MESGQNGTFAECLLGVAIGQANAYARMEGIPEPFHPTEADRAKRLADRDAAWDAHVAGMAGLGDDASARAEDRERSRRAAVAIVGARHARTLGRPFASEAEEAQRDEDIRRDCEDDARWDRIEDERARRRCEGDDV